MGSSLPVMIAKGAVLLDFIPSYLRLRLGDVRFVADVATGTEKRVVLFATQFDLAIRSVHKRHS
jgi:hypothetical protein